MNQLSTSKRVEILTLLLKGTSIRSTARSAGVSINTVGKLLKDAGAAGSAHHDERVRGIRGRRNIECHETWAFGDHATKDQQDSPSPHTWTFTAIDADSGLIVSYSTGGRQAAIALATDLRNRLEAVPRLSTTGMRIYPDTVTDELQKEPIARSAPDRSHPREIAGNPYLDRHEAVIRLYVLHFNFCRTNKKRRRTPAMQAGLDDTRRDMEWIVGLIDARAPKPNRPKVYRKRHG